MFTRRLMLAGLAGAPLAALPTATMAAHPPADDDYIDVQISCPNTGHTKELRLLHRGHRISFDLRRGVVANGKIRKRKAGNTWSEWKDLPRNIRGHGSITHLGSLIKVELDGDYHGIGEAVVTR